MPTITLPDGSQRSFDHSVSVAEVAASIGAGLAKATVAGKVDGKLSHRRHGAAAAKAPPPLEVVENKSVAL